MIKKESRQFFISVEGVNCETMYFEHVAELINQSNSTYNLKICPRKSSPLEFAKQTAYRTRDRNRNSLLPYIHIQDIEDYHDEFHRAKFYKLIDEIRITERLYKISYALGYTNYTFELWMLLHVAKMDYQVQGRKAYLQPINKWFKKNYSSLDEFKRKTEFEKILNEFVTLDSVKLAVQRAEAIVLNNTVEHKSKEIYKGFAFFHDNPDLSLHNIIKLIFETCEVK